MPVATYTNIRFCSLPLTCLKDFKNKQILFEELMHGEFRAWKVSALFFSMVDL